MVVRSVSFAKTAAVFAFLAVGGESILRPILRKEEFFRKSPDGNET
jgi:hypothetical protein